jgi:hypothetical protein
VLRVTQVLLLALGLGLAGLAAVKTASEMVSADRSASRTAQISATVIVTGLYFMIGILAFKEVRTSGILAVLIPLLMTPVLGLLWLASQWSTQSSERATWLLKAIAANVVLWLAGLYAFVSASMRRQD